MRGLIDDLDQKWQDTFGGTASQNDLLRSINQRLGAVLSQGGAASVDGVTGVLRPEYGVMSPGLVSVPVGRAEVDFVDGVVRHSTESAAVDEFRELSDLSGQPNNLRSLSVFLDAPATLDVGQASLPLDAGHHQLEGLSFDSVGIEADAPLRFGVAGSVRSDALGARLNGDLYRTGSRSGTLDAYTRVPVGPEGVPASNRVAPVPLSTVEDGRLFVENTSATDNNLDVRLVAASASDGTYRDTGLKSTGIPQGDHVLIEFDGAFEYVAIEVQNNTNGSQIEATVELMGGL